MKQYDALVIGAGVNGLTCGAYLARAGMRVLVLEARERAGGMAELASSAGWLSPAVMRGLGLRRHGLRLSRSEVGTFAPHPDGSALTLWADAERTARELADNPLVGPRDAEAYAAADARLRGLASAVARLLRQAPSEPNPLAALLGTRELPMAVGDLLGEWFESDALRAAVAARALLYSGLAPRAPGTAALLLSDAALSGTGLAGAAAYADGGPQAVTDALAAALREHGGEIRTAARVARVRHDRAANSVRGVTLDNGAEIDARLVISTLDPQTTLLDLLEPEVLGPRLSWRASNIRQTGTMARVEYRLSGGPKFAGADGDPKRVTGRIVIAPSVGYLELATRPTRYGASADEPLVELVVADGRATALAQAFAPDIDSETVAERVTAAIEACAPGFASLVEERTVMTPRDIEHQYGARGGHPMHADVALDQWWEWRPLHGLGRYRMPLDGYYLAGAGAHPGGGVTGLVGRLAAQHIVADTRQGRLRLSV